MKWAFAREPIPMLKYIEEVYADFRWYVWFAACVVGDLGPSFLRDCLDMHGDSVALILTRVIDAYCEYTPVEAMNLHTVVFLLVYFFNGRPQLRPVLRRLAHSLVAGSRAQQAHVSGLLRAATSGAAHGSIAASRYAMGPEVFAEYVETCGRHDDTQPPWVRAAPPASACEEATFDYLTRLLSSMMPGQYGSEYDAVLDHSAIYQSKEDPALRESANVAHLKRQAQLWFDATL